MLNTYNINKMENHYDNFINFFAVYVSENDVRQHLHEIEPVLQELQNVFLDSMLEKLIEHKILFNYKKYTYRMLKMPDGSFIDSVLLYNDAEKLIITIKDRLDFIINQIKLTFIKKEDVDIVAAMDPSINTLEDVHNIIYNLRNKYMFINNNIFSSFYSILPTKYSNYNNGVPVDYEIIHITARDHARILLKLNKTNTLYYFDPSFFASSLPEITFNLDMFGLECREGHKIYVNHNFQHVDNIYIDIFCYFWCYHFIHYMLTINCDPVEYITMFEISDNQQYLKEIKTFIIKFVKDSQVFEKYKGIHWGGDIYKQKYLAAKNNTKK